MSIVKGGQRASYPFLFLFFKKIFSITVAFKIGGIIFCDFSLGLDLVVIWIIILSFLEWYSNRFLAWIENLKLPPLTYLPWTLNYFPLPSLNPHVYMLIVSFFLNQCSKLFFSFMVCLSCLWLVKNLFFTTVLFVLTKL